MSEVFLDTSYLIALLASDDQHHARAKTLASSGVAAAVTTEYVLIELCDGFAPAHLRLVADRAVRAILSNPAITVVPGGSDLVNRGLSLYSSRPDKEWGLTDCISFVVMKERGISDAFTADRHFEQAGFRAAMRV
jgi:hypothetical protein